MSKLLALDASICLLCTFVTRKASRYKWIPNGEGISGKLSWTYTKMMHTQCSESEDAVTETLLSASCRSSTRDLWKTFTNLAKALNERYWTPWACKAMIEGSSMILFQITGAKTVCRQNVRHSKQAKNKQNENEETTREILRLSYLVKSRGKMFLKEQCCCAIFWDVNWEVNILGAHSYLISRSLHVR